MHSPEASILTLPSIGEMEWGLFCEDILNGGGIHIALRARWPALSLWGG